jgi:hypothetical protein
MSRGDLMIRTRRRSIEEESPYRNALENSNGVKRSGVLTAVMASEVDFVRGELEGTCWFLLE